MNSGSEEEAGLPEEIGLAANQGDFERVKAWLAGGSATAPRSVNDVDEDGWTLLMDTATSDAMTPEHVETHCDRMDSSGRRRMRAGGGTKRKTQGSLLGVLVDHLLQLVLRLARLDRDVVARI